MQEEIKWKLVTLREEIEEKDKSISEMKTKFVSCSRNYTNEKHQKQQQQQNTLSRKMILK